ncbi:LysR family transcriptional regulator [Herbaspirillum seropedicae]|uniref:LysR family transcriptional regulator n=1 Tax=Herbaspirillum seropedicae TaxID=964 RepID=UPI0008639BD2|nr:LysR family transcriptional regulator [Herbaspirillum seropedicae]AON55815.1 hypothetical protein Hsc_3549 [Herbaspirillum seropedicae]MDR6395225.1 DNA-binding transcriptional LysR family regulator [Herbaspirillum seropedicae]
MTSLEHYRIFIATVEAKNLTAAAKKLGCSLQTVSRSLTALETELGVALVQRTTRRMQVTAAGGLFYDRLKSAINDLDEATNEARRSTTDIFGLFRIGASVQFSPRYIVPAVATFVERYPNVEVDLVLSDAIVDLLENKLDIVIRIGDPESSTLKSRLLAKLRRVVVATPQYIAKHGRPSHPSDLAKHACVVRTFGPEGDVWPLTENGSLARVSVTGRFRCNDAASANTAVLNGVGIGLAPLWQVRNEIDQGVLEILLPDYEPLPVPVHALWHENSALPARTRAFIDLLRGRISSERI